MQMNLHITKSKNAESFYIAKSYAKSGGGTSSKIIRKLGTLELLPPEHGPTRDDVLAWAKNEVKLETEKYKKEKRQRPYWFHSMPTGSLTMACRSFTGAATCSRSPFIMECRCKKYAGG